MVWHLQSKTGWAEATHCCGPAASAKAGKPCVLFKYFMFGIMINNVFEKKQEVILMNSRYFTHYDDEDGDDWDDDEDSDDDEDGEEDY